MTHRGKIVPNEVKQAIAHFDRAIQLQPDYAQAYAELAGAWLELQTLEAEFPARQAITKALELDPQLAEAHAAMGRLKMDYEWDWAGSDREYHRALELSPTSLDFCECYPHLLIALGRADEALSILDRYRKRNPLSAAVETAYGGFFYFTRNYPEAVPHLRRAIEIDPLNPARYGWLAEAYEQLRDYAKAIEVGEQSARTFGNDPRKAAPIGRFYLEAGRRADAEYALSSQLRQPGFAENISLLYFALGDRDKGFEWLEKMLDRRVKVYFLKIEPVYDNFRSDPRFQALLHRIGLDRQQ
jgi:tetratricopeptide (TPR) repeat protein